MDGRQHQNPYNKTISELKGMTCNNDRVFKFSFVGFGLNGTNSPFISNFTNLQSLGLSTNHLIGQMSMELQHMVNLVVLNIFVNELTSQIPPSLILCDYINAIDLHDNRITSNIHPQLGLLTRPSAFDVSKKKIHDMIPLTLVNKSGVFLRFNESSFLGNKEFYGCLLSMPKSHRDSMMAIVGIELASGMLSVVVSFTAIYIWLRLME